MSSENNDLVKFSVKLLFVFRYLWSFYGMATGGLCTRQSS